MHPFTAVAAHCAHTPCHQGTNARPPAGIVSGADDSGRSEAS